MIENIIYAVMIIIIVLAAFSSRGLHRGFDEGKNTIFKNKTYESKLDIATEPQLYELQAHYPYKFKLYSAFFFTLSGVAIILFTYFFIKHDFMLFMFFGGGIILVSLLWINTIMMKKEKYKEAIFKIGYNGLWTLNLGYVSWIRIKEINIYYVYVNKLKPREMSYLEIITYKKEIDKLMLHEIGYDKQKMQDIIEEYSPQKLEEYQIVE